MADAILQCPRCGAGMVSFLRNGITVEECARCRGVFLGWSDMERLLGRGAVGTTMNGHHPAPPYEGRHRRD